jgi:hypothetical protein
VDFCHASLKAETTAGNECLLDVLFLDHLLTEQPFRRRTILPEHTTDQDHSVAWFFLPAAGLHPVQMRVEQNSMPRLVFPLSIPFWMAYRCMFMLDLRITYNLPNAARLSKGT